MLSRQLESKCQISQYIEEELFQMKRNINLRPDEVNLQNNSACSYLQTSINVKNGFMQLAQGIQTQRLFSQIQKDKFLNRKVYLQGLKTLKEKLKFQVNQRKKACQMQSEKSIEKPSKLQSQAVSFQKKQAHQSNQLMTVDRNQQRYKKRLLQRQRLQAIIQNNKRQSNFMKNSLQHFRIQLQQMQSVQFNQYKSSSKITNENLESINDKFGASKQQNTIDVVFSNDSFQELQIIINPSNYQSYVLCNANKIDLQEKTIKITIASVAPHQSHLVVGFGQLENFTNKDIFDHLYNNEEVKTIFYDTNAQILSDINSKYVQLNWINELLPGQAMSAQYFLELIKQRVFCLRLMRYLSKNIKTDFLFPLQSNLKDITQRTLEEITFEQYLQLVHQPSWVNKQLQIYAPASSQIQQMTNSTNLVKKGRTQFVNFLQKLNLEELMQKNINSYYKGTFHIVYKVLTYILIVPKTYPAKPSRINIVKWQNILKKEDYAVNLDLPCAFKYSSRQTPINDRILAIQHEVNEEITKSIKEKHKVFRTLIQLNRLLTLMGQTERLL